LLALFRGGDEEKAEIGAILLGYALHELYLLRTAWTKG
jgi:hypothetical protein